MEQARFVSPFCHLYSGRQSLANGELFYLLLLIQHMTVMFLWQSGTGASTGRCSALDSALVVLQQLRQLRKFDA